MAGEKSARGSQRSLAQSHNEERVIILQIHKQYTAAETEAAEREGGGGEGRREGAGGAIETATETDIDIETGNGLVVAGGAAREAGLEQGRS